jgi:hypothetical protein
MFVRGCALPGLPPPQNVQTKLKRPGDDDRRSDLTGNRPDNTGWPTIKIDSFFSPTSVCSALLFYLRLTHRCSCYILITPRRSRRTSKGLLPAFRMYRFDDGLRLTQQDATPSSTLEAAY